MAMLSQRLYYVTWKADGTRYMMLLCRDGCYVIDRNFKFRRLQMRFPLRASGSEVLDIGCSSIVLSALKSQTTAHVLPPKGKWFGRRFLLLGNEMVTVCATSGI